MNSWLLNTIIELKLTFRDRQALFWTYVFPLLFLFLFCAVFGRGNPMMFLGGAAIPKFLLPPAIQKISRLTPSNYMVEGLGRIMVEGKSLSDSGAQLIVLSMTTVTALFIAAKLFRWESNEPLSWAKRAWVAAIALIFVLAALR